MLAKRLTVNLSGNVLRSQPAHVNSFHIWTVYLVQLHWRSAADLKAVVVFITGSPLLPSLLLGLVLGLEHILGVLCSCSLFVTVLGKPLSFLEIIMGSSLGDF